MWYVVLTFIDDIFRSDFLRSFIQFQHHNITSDKWSDQNNKRFYHVKQTVENRRPSKMGDVATLLFVHFNFIIQFRNMFFYSWNQSTLHIKSNLCFIYRVLFYFVLFCFFCFFKDYLTVGPLWWIRCTY